MSVASQRLLAFLDSLTQAAMREGYLPDPTDVQRQMLKFARERDLSLPSLKYRPQPRRGTFDVSAYNDMVKEVIEDLDFAFVEETDLTNRLVRALNEAYVRHGIFSHQIGEIDDLLEVLLLAEPGATGYFMALLDRFRDFSKIDQSQTTADVEITSGVVHLPMVAGVSKIPLPHLAERSNIVVVSDGEIISQGLISGSRFGSAFDDTISGWQHQIKTRSSKGWSGSITLPVSMIPAGTPNLTGGMAGLPAAPVTREIYISRIDIDGLNGTPVEVQILYSVDGKNFLHLPGYKTIELAGRKQSLFFERIKVEYLKILFAKTIPDDDDNAGTFTYVIGLRNFSIYDAGFGHEAQLVTKELVPETDIDIGRVTLDVDEQTPNGTSIEYYVAAYSATPSWHPITPLSRASAGETPILDLSEALVSPRRDNRSLVTATPAVNSTRNGITFYNIYALNGDQIPETVELYRGVGGWAKQTNVVEELVVVHNNYVAFTQDDSFQKLYVEINDEVITPPASSPGVTTVVTVSRPVLYDRSLRLTPGSNLSSAIPDYCVRRVLLLNATAPGGTDTISIATGANGARTVRLTTATITENQVKAGDQINLSRAGVLSDRFFTILGVTWDGAQSTLEIDDPSKELITGAWDWEINGVDITSSVIATNNNTISIDSSITLLTTDRLQVSYRSPLAADEMLLTSTIVVKDSESGSSSTYALGRDFVVDGDQKGISRNPEGQIALTKDGKVVVRVDFSFKRLSSRLDTYTCYLHYGGDGAPIRFTPISVDSLGGEGIFLDTGNEVLDLSRVSEIRNLKPGWRRLTVRSKNAATVAGAVDTSTAIYKAINAVDENAYLLFGPAHFSEQVGYQTPLKYVTLFYLQTSVAKDDRSVFALDGDNVVISWDPTLATDVFYMIPGSATILKREEFGVEYTYQVSGAEQIRSLLLKAILKRNTGSTGDKTPLLRRYTLRLAH